VPVLPSIRDIARSLRTLLASPFQLLERSKGRWRTALLVLYALLAIVICTPLVRKARLNQIPDLGDPFDVPAFRDGGSDDAFPLYHEALARYHPPPQRPPAGRSSALYGNLMLARFVSSCADPEVQAWINSNREARDLWLRATARPGLGYHPWDGRGFGAEWFDVGEVRDEQTGKPISLRVDDLERGILRRLGEHEALRLEKEGDLAGAWTWHNAALRYSRHVGMRTIFADRLQAVLLHRVACDRAESWATDDHVDAALLRRALADALAVGTMTAPLSDAIKADYLEAMLFLDHPPGSLVNRVLDDFKGSREGTSASPSLPRQRTRSGRGNDGFEDEGDRFLRHLPDLPTQATYYFNGEPERSKRLVRQVYANWLANCDLPRASQPPAVTGFNLFVAPASSPGTLPADELARELDRPGPARYILPSWTELQKALQDERTRQARLVVAIAEELYLREHGKRPASARELVGTYLSELPEGFVDENPDQTPTQ
jgi:hypothetical protein